MVGATNWLASIHLVIDKHNTAVEPRKGTLAVPAMFLAVVAASIVYWTRFLKFSAVGMVGTDDSEECHSSGLICMYIFGCSVHYVYYGHDTNQ
jgi:hypothetical protein